MQPVKFKNGSKIARRCEHSRLSKPFGGNSPQRAMDEVTEATQIDCKIIARDLAINTYEYLPRKGKNMQDGKGILGIIRDLK